MREDGNLYRAVVFHDWLIDAISGDAMLISDVLRAARRLEIDDDEIIVEWCDWAPLSF